MRTSARFYTYVKNPWAKAQGVFGFLNMLKNAFAFCELKQTAYTKSIFDMLKLWVFD
jgi:hypothetical protein